jgi:hypothetical protein
VEVDEVVEGDKNEQIASLKPTASGFCGPAEPQPACHVPTKNWDYANFNRSLTMKY